MENSDAFGKVIIIMGFIAVYCTIMKFTMIPNMPWFGLIILYFCEVFIIISWYIDKKMKEKEEIAKKTKRTSTKKSKPAVK
jgi:flagellar biosynthesis component FlhA